MPGAKAGCGISRKWTSRNSSISPIRLDEERDAVNQSPRRASASA